MVSLDDSLVELVDRGQIAFETAYPYFEDVEKRSALQKRFYRVASVPEPSARRS
jgi:hypothetical protein